MWVGTDGKLGAMRAMRAMRATPAIDRTVQAWIAGHHVHWVDRAALALTNLGSTPVALTVTVAVGVVASWRASAPRWPRSSAPRWPQSSARGTVASGGRVGRWWPLAACVAGELAVEGAARLVKVLVGRPRPPFDQAVVVLANSSLPAAHVARVLYAGCLVWAVLRSERARRWALAGVVAVVVVVAWTRVQLGAHWLTDTFAAVPLALLAAALPVRLLRRLRRGPCATGPGGDIDQVGGIGLW
jgi:undecaprenyl-diphosphatase